ncbi:MAG: Beta-lactamase [Parcubacteria group bacterium GW2011_GWA1_56_13]|nr:MAG: Beta-lactamase [Parcubacteria group bacterium GW2011_GWA1_56_13]
MYDIASITKSIPTASLALMLIDQGELKLTDKLIDHVPEFNNSDRENVLIKHLLTYTLDGYKLATALDGGKFDINKDKTATQLLNILLTHDFEKRPGTVFNYTNIPAALLGLVVERIYGKTLDVLADEHFFVPLGMTRSTFYPEKFPTEDIPPTEIDSWRGEVRGVVHDESAYIAKRDGRIVGHAGLFSTAGDILTFLEMLLNGGIFNGKTFFSEEILQQMETNQIPELNNFTGLGWELNQPRYMGKYCGEHTFGKTGFTGTLCVADRQEEVAYVILSNRVYPKRTKDSAAINAFRAAVGEIVLAS